MTQTVNATNQSFWETTLTAKTTTQPSYTVILKASTTARYSYTVTRYANTIIEDSQTAIHSRSVLLHNNPRHQNTNTKFHHSHPTLMKIKHSHLEEKAIPSTVFNMQHMPAIPCERHFSHLHGIKEQPHRSRRQQMHTSKRNTFMWESLFVFWCGRPSSTLHLRGTFMNSCGRHFEWVNCQSTHKCSSCSHLGSTQLIKISERLCAILYQFSAHASRPKSQRRITL